MKTEEQEVAFALTLQSSFMQSPSKYSLLMLHAKPQATLGQCAEQGSHPVPQLSACLLYLRKSARNGNIRQIVLQEDSRRVTKVSVGDLKLFDQATWRLSETPRQVP